MIDTTQGKIEQRKGKAVLCFKLTGQEDFWRLAEPVEAKKAELKKITEQLKPLYEKGKALAEEMELAKTLYWQAIKNDFSNPDAFKEMSMEIDPEAKELHVFYDVDAKTKVKGKNIEIESTEVESTAGIGLAINANKNWTKEELKAEITRQFEADRKTNPELAEVPPSVFDTSIDRVTDEVWNDLQKRKNK